MGCRLTLKHASAAADDDGVWLAPRPRVVCVHVRCVPRVFGGLVCPHHPRPMQQ